MNNLRQKDIEVNGEKISIPFPTVGQVMRIEAMKMTFSNNQYPRMVGTGIPLIDFNLDLIDTVCYFSVLIPDFATKFKADSMSPVELEAIKPWIKAYKDQWHPWFHPIMEGIMDFSVKGEKKD